MFLLEQRAFKIVNNCLNTNISSNLEGGQSSYLYLNGVHFLTPVLFRHLSQLKTVVFLHLYLIGAVHRHLRKDRQINGSYCLPCLSNQYCQWPLQRRQKCLESCGASSGHITKLKQSIFFRYLWCCSFGFGSSGQGINWIEKCFKVFVRTLNLHLA